MAEIIQRFLTNNDCYKAGKKITPKGIMVHSTGAKNPKLSRYIQPDDGILGVNPNNNDWNRRGTSKCVHGFIGKDKNGKVRTYQTLPWNYRGWHGGGSSNDTHIGFEICEDGLDDPVYFKEVYSQAVELCAFLSKEYNLDVSTIICHSEGFKKGIASNHADVMHWFPKHGKSMDILRADVKERLNPTVKVAAETTSPYKESGVIRYIETGGYAGPALQEVHNYLFEIGHNFDCKRAGKGSIVFLIGPFDIGMKNYNECKYYLDKAGHVNKLLTREEAITWR